MAKGGVRSEGGLLRLLGDGVRSEGSRPEQEPSVEEERRVGSSEGAAAAEKSHAPSSGPGSSSSSSSPKSCDSCCGAP